MTDAESDPPDVHWSDDANAERYAEFTRSYRMYADTSRELVALADIASVSTVVDLACGTGMTTEAVLAELPRDGSVVAVDGSAAMLAQARRQVTDPRVTWRHSRIEELEPADSAGSVDAVLCSSAIWQMDMPVTFALASRLLRPGGRLVFNLPAWLLGLPPTGSDRGGLFDLLHVIALEDYGAVPVTRKQRSHAAFRPHSPEELAVQLSAAGFHVKSATTHGYPGSPEQTRAWLSIPIFWANTGLLTLTTMQRADVLARAYDRWNKAVSATDWYVVCATRS